MVEITANTLYDNNKRELQEYFWGIVPTSIGDALRTSYTKTLPQTNEYLIDGLEKVLWRYHLKLGILTEKVEENLSKLREGVIITGQQPAPCGGKGFIGNKISTICKLAKLSEENSKTLVPVFYVADYDGIQSEITHTHFPNPSSSKSVAISITAEELVGRAANTLQLPGPRWLKIVIEELSNLYTEFFADTSPPVRKLLNTRLECLLALLSTTYLSSSTLTGWFVKIWGTIANIHNDFGVIFLPMSNPEVRDIVIQGGGYEQLVKKRKTFIEQFNRASEKLRQYGIKTAVGDRPKDYVPFFLECDHDAYRVNLSFEQGMISGTCPICGMRYEIPFDENNPNFDNIRRQISPRVDSSHILVQFLLPIKIRVSGPGEISYFAQVFPAASAIGIKMPVLLKYTRMFYNAPWLETLGKKISEKNLPSLHSRDFFKALSGWVKAKRRNEPELLLQATERLTNLINSVYNSLQTIPDKDVERYLSWQFGVFGTGTFGQEVSWNWIDLAVNTGIEDYLQTYMRYYENETPISGYYFLNTLTT
ncbi:MAG: bacillithiol biosynthesis BshC [Candidatus Heimdallarchaeota archaeon]